IDKLGADPFTDAQCIIAAVNDDVQLPASCDGCADQLGGDVENAISSVADSIGNIIDSIF
ncbi:hypothetical protein DFH06DRAFT_1305689, partial [Mycena polygramma]